MIDDPINTNLWKLLHPPGNLTARGRLGGGRAIMASLPPATNNTLEPASPAGDTSSRPIKQRTRDDHRQSELCEDSIIVHDNESFCSEKGTQVLPPILCLLRMNFSRS